MAGYRCRVQGTRPSVSSIPSSSFDRWGSAERGGILREGIETRARRAKLFRGKLIRSRERAWNYRRWSVGEEERGGRREEGGTRSLIDVCRKSDRYFGTIRLFFLGSFVQGHLVANHLESVVYALLLFFSFFRSSSCLLVSSSSSFSFSFPFLPFFSAV